MFEVDVNNVMEEWRGGGGGGDQLVFGVLMWFTVNIPVCDLQWISCMWNKVNIPVCDLQWIPLYVIYS